MEDNRVVVTDIDIKFGSMVFLLIKLSLAIIPAALILTIISVLVGGIIAGLSEKSEASPSRIPSPCENYFNFINDVVSERLAGYPADMYQSHPAKGFRDAATYIYTHTYREIEDWKWDQLEKCDSGKLDPYADAPTPHQ